MRCWQWYASRSRRTNDPLRVRVNYSINYVVTLPYYLSIPCIILCITGNLLLSTGVLLERVSANSNQTRCDLNCHSLKDFAILKTGTISMKFAGFFIYFIIAPYHELNCGLQEKLYKCWRGCWSSFSLRSSSRRSPVLYGRSLIFLESSPLLANLLLCHDLDLYHGSVQFCVHSIPISRRLWFI